MKKTKPKAASAPAPAPKAAAKRAPKSAAKKKTPATVAPVVKPSAPAVKPGAPAPVVTVVTAHIDIGFGNTLYLRGQGSGLSWDRGIPLECADDNIWTITLPETALPIICKLLVNDLTWSAGSDYVVQPGSTVTIEPTF
jgi:hypothetical protein